MAKANWEFPSDHSWQEFAESFRCVVGKWKPSPVARLAGLELQFTRASDLSGGAFEDLDRSVGAAFDVNAGIFHSNGQNPSGVRLTLEETAAGGTHGVIRFAHALGSAGRDLGELTQRSVRAVDSGIRF